MTDEATIGRETLERADLRVLVMCLVHLTGDLGWLEEPFTPARDVRLVADPRAGFDDDTREKIIEAMLQAIGDGIPNPVIDRPDPRLLHRMMSVFLGEEVPEEYVAMTMSDMGLVERAGPIDPGLPTPDVLIVGAGVSGIALAARLLGEGVDVRVVDRNPDLGGTWFENRYPGCGVDTPNHFYSFPWAPKPDWSRFFSPRAEIHGYLADVARERGVLDRTRFGVEMVRADWSEGDAHWAVTLRSIDSGETWTETTRVLVPATGHFSEPHRARFDGEENFSGPVFHTARWPDGVDLTGKRVAVIGTGATSMQLVPTIADEVEHLVVFQRTPPWVRPFAEYRDEVDPRTVELFASLPWYGRWYRFGLSWRYGDGLLRFLRRDPEWPHPERSMNRINDRHRVEMTEFITDALAGRPDLIEHCIPTYPPFGKRILIDNGWFDTISRPDVELEVTPIARFSDRGVVTTSGTTHEVDAVIVATGFDVVALDRRVHLSGRDGVSLSDVWTTRDPRALLGMSVVGMPNLFLMYGPNTNMGHGGSVMWMSDTQAAHIAAWVRRMAEERIATVEVRAEAVDAYTAEVDRLHDELVWTHPGTPTYYRTPEGRVRSPMPFRLVDYWSRTQEIDEDAFVITHFSTVTT